MTDDTLLTTYSCICAALLREVRMERGIHQAQVVDWIGETPSAWTKVKAGKSPLWFESFVRVCNSMLVAPSLVMTTAERYVALISSNCKKEGMGSTFLGSRRQRGSGAFGCSGILGICGFPQPVNEPLEPKFCFERNHLPPEWFNHD